MRYGYRFVILYVSCVYVLPFLRLRSINVSYKKGILQQNPQHPDVTRCPTNSRKSWSLCLSRPKKNGKNGHPSNTRYRL